MAVRRSRDIKFVYTTDSDSNLLAVQRTYVETNTGETLTVITPLFLAREYNSEWKIEPIDRRARKIEVCKNVNGKEGNYDSLMPYNSNDPMHKEHAKEIITSEGVLSFIYIGESRDA